MRGWKSVCNAHTDAKPCTLYFLDLSLMWWGGSTHCQNHKLNTFWDMCIIVYAHLRKKSNYKRDPSDYPPGKWAFYLIFISHWWFSWHTHTETTAWRFVIISQRWYQFQSNGCSWWSMMWRTLCVFWRGSYAGESTASKAELTFSLFQLVACLERGRYCPMMQPYLLISCMFVCWVQCSWRFCCQCQRFFLFLGSCYIHRKSLSSFRTTLKDYSLS